MEWRLEQVDFGLSRERYGRVDSLTLGNRLVFLPAAADVREHLMREHQRVVAGAADVRNRFDLYLEDRHLTCLKIPFGPADPATGSSRGTYRCSTRSAWRRPLCRPRTLGESTWNKLFRGSGCGPPNLWWVAWGRHEVGDARGSDGRPKVASSAGPTEPRRSMVAELVDCDMVASSQQAPGSLVVSPALAM